MVLRFKGKAGDAEGGVWGRVFDGRGRRFPWTKPIKNPLNKGLTESSESWGRWIQTGRKPTAFSFTLILTSIMSSWEKGLVGCFDVSPTFVSNEPKGIESPIFNGKVPDLDPASI